MPAALLRRNFVALGAASLLVCPNSSGSAQHGGMRIDIGKNGVGVPPDDFHFWQTGGGAPGRWSVIRDPTASEGLAIEQFSSDTTENRFPLAIYKPILSKNLKVRTRFKIVSGRMRIAGIAFRLTSASQYYVVAASALETRVDLFSILDGKMKRIAGVDAEVATDKWHALTVVAEEDHFIISFEGRRLFTASDPSIGDKGYAALWTNEDNVTRFDELVIAAGP